MIFGVLVGGADPYGWMLAGCFYGDDVVFCCICATPHPPLRENPKSAGLTWGPRRGPPSPSGEGCVLVGCYCLYIIKKLSWYRELQSVDKVYTLSETERNEGRFGDFFLVGIVVYGRGKNSPKADVAGFRPPFQYQMISSRNICFMQILLLTSALYRVCLQSEALGVPRAFLCSFSQLREA